jgi:hypothetical protein
VKDLSDFRIWEAQSHTYEFCWRATPLQTLCHQDIMPRMHSEGSFSPQPVSATTSSTDLDASGNKINQKNREGFAEINKRTVRQSPSIFV